MLNDPVTITYNGSSVDLARVSLTPSESVFQSNDGQLRLTITKATSGDGASETLARLERFTSDGSWADGNPPAHHIGEFVGVSRTVKADETARTHLRTAATTFLSTYGSKLVGGEY